MELRADSREGKKPGSEERQRQRMVLAEHANRVDGEMRKEMLTTPINQHSQEHNQWCQNKQLLATITSSATNIFSQRMCQNFNSFLSLSLSPGNPIFGSL